MLVLIKQAELYVFIIQDHKYVQKVLKIMCHEKALLERRAVFSNSFEITVSEAIDVPAFTKRSNIHCRSITWTDKRHARKTSSSL
jgi:hypothetical protein